MSTIPRWRAGVTDGLGKEVAFDTPKCLFAFLQTDQGRRARAPWVTEYYSQRRASATELFYILGSDVSGPMGPDLVPVRTEDAARRFAREHTGREVLTFDATQARAASR